MRVVEMKPGLSLELVDGVELRSSSSCGVRLSKEHGVYRSIIEYDKSHGLMRTNYVTKIFQFYSYSPYSILA